jgi:hypothetical protein
LRRSQLGTIEFLEFGESFACKLNAGLSKFECFGRELLLQEILFLSGEVTSRNRLIGISTDPPSRKIVKEIIDPALRRGQRK